MAITARADAHGAFNGLFLGLGAVALLVGAVGAALLIGALAGLLAALRAARLSPTEALRTASAQAPDADPAVTAA